MVKNKNCRVCNVELTDENWYPSRRERKNHICKKCDAEQTRSWQKANPNEYKAFRVRANYRHGKQPFNGNRDCTLFLGVHVAERVLSKVFKDVERMPMNNPGYDFICGGGYKIDVKSPTARSTGGDVLSATRLRRRTDRNFQFIMWIWTALKVVRATGSSFHSANHAMPKHIMMRS